MAVKIVSGILQIETIAVGRKIRELPRLLRTYGSGRWRKLKGIARVSVGFETFTAEVHWYEVDGIGRKEFKIKRILAK